MPRFTQQNTDGYTDAELAQLNAEFDAGVAQVNIDQDSWTAFCDNFAEHVLSQFELERSRRPRLRTIRVSLSNAAGELDVRTFSAAVEPNDNEDLDAAVTETVLEMIRDAGRLRVGDRITVTEA